MRRNYAHPRIHNPSQFITPHLHPSLSGGVDSMVICQILVVLRSHYPLDVTGVHIDYGNRKESANECDFVRRWCEERDVKFVSRRIDEVRRGVTGRDEYEKVARDIRYNTYKEVLGGADNIKGIVFGHHSGDVVENVISNSMKGKGVLHLSGMGQSGVVNGVTVERPLIDRDKTDILAFAKKWGVPFFNDTTPSWSTRGKMRGEVIPMLEDVFGEGVQKVLRGLAGQSDQCRDMVDEEVVSRVLGGANFKPGGTHVNLDDFRDRNAFFYRTVLQAVLHRTGLPMISAKAIETLMKHLGLEDIGDRWLQLKPDYGTMLRSDGTLFVFKSRFFKWGKAGKRWREEEQDFRLGVGGKGRVGDWTIRTEVVDNFVGGEECTAEEAIEKVKSKPYESLEDLFAGRFSYNIIVKTKRKDKGRISPIIATKPPRALSPPRKYSGMNGSPLSLSSRSSEEDIRREEELHFPTLTLSGDVKPHGWRGIHTKIIESLPILDLTDREGIQPDEWDYESFNYSVVRVEGVVIGEGGVVEEGAEEQMI